MILIYPRLERRQDNQRLEQVLAHALAGVQVRTVHLAQELDGLSGERLLFAVPVGECGVNPEYQRMLARLRAEPYLLEGCVAGLVVDGSGELYTKSTATELTLAANLAGCAFVGCPLVEGTGSLSNFRVRSVLLHTDLQGAYYAAARELVERVRSFAPAGKERPRLLALHASTRQVSNTMDLWEQVKRRVEEHCDIEEIGLRNGTLADCSGCPYTTCLHFGEQGGCFYGGVMQEEVYPAVRRADALVMICPNYNDALSANITAFINRLTALFRQTRFYDKSLYAIVVSGYSGGDVVARQLVSALNMNKSFYLPGRFAMIETANDPGAAMRLHGIEERLGAFAGNILNTQVQKGNMP